MPGQFPEAIPGGTLKELQQSCLRKNPKEISQRARGRIPEETAV